MIKCTPARVTGAPPPASTVPQTRLWVDVWPEIDTDVNGRPVFVDGKVW